MTVSDHDQMLRLHYSGVRTVSHYHLFSQQYAHIKKLTRHVTAVPDPSYIFEVVYGDTAERKFQMLRNGRKLMLAYHGSRVENFHSILHNGLASHMNKVPGCSLT